MAFLGKENCVGMGNTAYHAHTAFFSKMEQGLMARLSTHPWTRFSYPRQ